MGVSLADVDGDGDLDLLVVNLDGESDSFYRNEKTFFRDDAAAVGLRTVSRPFTRFGAALLDFDNDGLLDLYEANGRVGRQSTLFSADPYAEPNLLFRGVAGPRFEEVTAARRHLAAARRHQPRRGVRRHRQRRRHRHRRRQPRRARRTCCTTSSTGRGHWAMLRVVDEHGRDALGAELTMTVGGRSDPARRARRLQLPREQRSARPRRARLRNGAARRQRAVADRQTRAIRRVAADKIVVLRRHRRPSDAPSLSRCNRDHDGERGARERPRRRRAETTAGSSLSSFLRAAAIVCK